MKHSSAKGCTPAFVGLSSFQVQLEYAIRTCRDCRTFSEAGRTLFFVSWQKRSQANDADRLRKYLLRFDLDWERIIA